MSDERWMDEALLEAHAAGARGEVPIGCVIVVRDEVIARASNRIEEYGTVLAHAELLAIAEAAKTLGRRLLDCTLYVTLEPCAMCAGAIVNARIPRVVYGADDPKAGAVRTLYSITEDARLNHQCDVRAGVGAERSAELLREFFKALRTEKKGGEKP
ncbi:MAG: nucleoside deaminase [Candidatus Kapaibacterium sp.]